VLNQLLDKGLVFKFGGSIHLTPNGREQIAIAIGGDYYYELRRQQHQLFCKAKKV